MKWFPAAFLIAATACLGQITISGPITIQGDGLGIAAGAIASPGAPVNLYPANNATRVIPNVVLTWGNNGGATSWDVYLDTTNGSTEVSAGQLTQSYTTSVAYGNKYYWKIVAHNVGGSASTSVYSFTTQAVNVVDFYMSFNTGDTPGNALTIADLNTGMEVNPGTNAFKTIADGSLLYTATPNLYQIAFVGTSNFTNSGAASNTVGTNFFATNAGNSGLTGYTIVPGAYVSGSPTALLDPFKVGSTVYTGASNTTAAEFNMAYQDNLAVNTFTTKYPALTIGYWFTFGPMASTNQEDLDFLQAPTNGGGFTDLGWTPSGSTIGRFNIEADAGPGEGSRIASTFMVITPGTYWITCYYSQHGIAGTYDRYYFYNPNGTLFGTLQLSTGGSTYDMGSYEALWIGRTDSHNSSNEPPNTSYLTFSNMGISHTTVAVGSLVTGRSYVCLTLGTAGNYTNLTTVGDTAVDAALINGTGIATNDSVYVVANTGAKSLSAIGGGAGAAGTVFTATGNWSATGYGTGSGVTVVEASDVFTATGTGTGNSTFLPFPLGP